MNNFNDLLPIKLVIVTSKLHHAINRRLNKHIKKLEVNRSEFLVLHALASKGVTSTQQIADMVHIASSTMTYTIDKLEKRNLVIREYDVQDRRVVFIKLTDKGRKMWDKTLAEHIDHLELLLEGIKPEELSIAIEIMKKIGKNIEKYEETLENN